MEIKYSHIDGTLETESSVESDNKILTSLNALTTCHPIEFHIKIIKKACQYQISHALHSTTPNESEAGFLLENNYVVNQKININFMQIENKS